MCSVAVINAFENSCLDYSFPSRALYKIGKIFKIYPCFKEIIKGSLKEMYDKYFCLDVETLVLAVPSVLLRMVNFLPDISS